MPLFVKTEFSFKWMHHELIINQLKTRVLKFSFSKINKRHGCLSTISYAKLSYWSDYNLNKHHL